MPTYLTKEEERILLLKRVFQPSFPGHRDMFALFEEGKRLGSQYCLGFNEDGYDQQYQGFESNRVTEEVA